MPLTSSVVSSQYLGVLMDHLESVLGVRHRRLQVHCHKLSKVMHGK